MENYECGIALPAMFDETVRASVDNARAAGFWHASLVWDREDRAALARNAAMLRAASMTLTSVHGPFHATPEIPDGINAMWVEGEAGDAYADILMDAAEDCAAAHAPLMVVHPNLGSFPPPPAEIGVRRFARVAAHMEALGIRLAIETMETPEHLFALLEGLPPDVCGICYDAGHCLAYTPETDYLSRYPGRIFTVHLHDNMGKTTDGPPHTRDDTHYLPFDGVRDWESAMRALARARYRGTLTLEVKRGRSVCPCRAEYAEWGERRFFAEAFSRGERLRRYYTDEIRETDKETTP